jgi:hypothetical protein
MKKLLLLFFISVSLISCKRYEDGPSISFRSAEKRLTGKWKVSQITNDDKDLTANYYSLGLDQFPFNIYSDWNHQNFISITNADGSIVAKSILSLNKKKNVMTFGLIPETVSKSIANNIFSIIPPLAAGNDWKILRLKNDEFWIRTNFDSNNFEIHFDLITDFNDY